MKLTKLIITMPEDKYKYIQELEQGNTDYAITRMLYHAVKNGKPFDKIRAEIAQAKREEPDVSDYQWNDGIAAALKIIDKYRGTDEITEHYKKLGEYYNGKDV